MFPKRREMDPAIWSRLPEDLLDHVLSFLPPKKLLKLRSTCKHFNSLLFSPSFLSKTKCSSSAFSCFILLSHPQCYDQYPLYDSTHGTWRRLSLPYSLLLPSAATLLSSSKGLLCFSLPSSSSFLVCNLVTLSSRTIDFPTYPFDFELLTLVSTPSGYKIFMLFAKSFPNYAFVYDSTDQSWSKFDIDGFPLTILSQSSHQEGVFYKGSLYFTTPEPFSIVRFDLENGIWETPNDANDHMTMMLPHELTFFRLVNDGEESNRLYLIGGVGRNGISTTMKLWELGCGGNWIEVERVPEMMCRKFMSVCYHNYDHVYCFWHQGMICVCCYTWPEILYYNVARRTWHWLPSCPSLPHKWSCGFRWFSFLPHLYALV